MKYLKKTLNLYFIAFLLIISGTFSSLQSWNLLVNNQSQQDVFFYAKAEGCALICSDPYGSDPLTCCGSILLPPGHEGYIIMSDLFGNETVYPHASIKDSKGNEVVYNYKVGNGTITWNIFQGKGLVFPTDFVKD